MWSTQNLDTTALTDAVNQALSSASNHTFQFNFAWNVLRKGEYSRNEKQTEKGKQYIRALHIEVPTSSKKQIYNALLRVFSSTSKHKILERDLRMIPVWRKDQTSHRKKKIVHLIEKQGSYLKNIETQSSHDFNDLDYVDKTLQTSLRKILMKLVTIEPVDEKGTCPKVFEAVDWNEYLGAHVFTFPRHLSQQATNYISQLPSLLHWMYGNEVLSMLSAEAVEEALDSPWDEEEMCAKSKADTELDTVMFEANNMKWVQVEDIAEIVDLDISRGAAANFMFHKSTDADSVSTFGSKRDPAQMQLDQLFKRQPKRTKTSDDDNTSKSDDATYNISDDATMVSAQEGERIPLSEKTNKAQNVEPMETDHTSNGTDRNEPRQAHPDQHDSPSGHESDLEARLN